MWFKPAADGWCTVGIKRWGAPGFGGITIPSSTCIHVAAADLNSHHDRKTEYAEDYFRVKTLDGQDELNCNYSLNRAARALHTWTADDDDESWDPEDSDNSDEWGDAGHWDKVYRVHIFRKRQPGPPPAYHQIPHESADGRVGTWVSSQHSVGAAAAQPAADRASSQQLAGQSQTGSRRAPSRPASRRSGSRAPSYDSAGPASHRPGSATPSRRPASRAPSHRSTSRSPAQRSASRAGSQRPASPRE